MIAALLLLTQIVAVPAEPKPVATTIAAIRANPKKFDGQLVRLHGWVNNCAPRSCLIEEHPTNSPRGSGEYLSISTDPKFDAIIKPLIPTYLEFDARFDASCLGTTTVCADRAPELMITQLRGVVDPAAPPPED